MKKHPIKNELELTEVKLRAALEDPKVIHCFQFIVGKILFKRCFFIWKYLQKFIELKLEKKHSKKVRF